MGSAEWAHVVVVDVRLHGDRSVSSVTGRGGEPFGESSPHLWEGAVADGDDEGGHALPGYVRWAFLVTNSDEFGCGYGFPSDDRKINRAVQDRVVACFAVFCIMSATADSMPAWWRRRCARMWRWTFAAADAYDTARVVVVE